jgi:hypothetical protein
MKPGIITLVFVKGSNWKGELYPNFDKESEQKLFEKKRDLRLAPTSFRTPKPTFSIVH